MEEDTEDAENEENKIIKQTKIARNEQVIYQILRCLFLKEEEEVATLECGHYQHFECIRVLLRKDASREYRIEDFKRLLIDILQQPENSHLREEEEMLIYPQNIYIASGEIGLGCELFKPPGSPKEQN